MARNAARTRSGSAPRPAEACLGRIVSIDAERRAHVRFAGCDSPLPARSLLSAPRVGELPADLVGATVLLWFENGDPSLPVIVGVVRDEIQPEPATAQLKLDLDANRDVLLDGARLVFEARHEVVLRCGKSTIVLQRDGKVLVRGTHVVSRSSGPNKLKGSSISLN